MISFALILFIVVSPAKFAAIVNNTQEWESELEHRNETERPLKDLEYSQGFSSESVIDEVNFYLYTQDTQQNPVQCRATNSILFDGRLDVTKPVKILIHGYKSDRNKFFAKTTREAYLQSAYYNIINVDWSQLSEKFYTTARGCVPAVGKVVAQFIDKLVNQTGLRADQLHVVGHSLGAHVSGVAGLNIKSGKLKRITGLDPAGPSFSCSDDDRLRPDSASFVDVIHTCGKGLGFYGTLGHVDFYPNHGTAPQPGCHITLGVCSHKRAVQLFAESISHRDAFLGTKCDHWEDYIKGHCDKNPTARMGEYASFSTSGKYWLRTRQATPYGFGPFATSGKRLDTSPPIMMKFLVLLVWPLSYWSTYSW